MSEPNFDSINQAWLTMMAATPDFDAEDDGDRAASATAGGYIAGCPTCSRPLSGVEHVVICGLSLGGKTGDDVAEITGLDLDAIRAIVVDELGTEEAAMVLGGAA